MAAATPQPFRGRPTPNRRGLKEDWRAGGDFNYSGCRGLPYEGRPPPETDDEYLEYYQDHISSSQSRQLLPLQEDLADWLNKTLGMECINASNILEMLDNGVVLCHLAKLISAKIQEAVEEGSYQGPVPLLKGKCFENAARRSFFSRDNMDKFIKFCRQLGVHQNLLFESEDLVLQNNPRSVVLCLMEVSRLASRFNIEPTGLVAFEKEIAEEESKHLAASYWQFQGTPANSKVQMRHSCSASALSAEEHKWDRSLERECSVSERNSLYIDHSDAGSGDALRTAIEGVQEVALAQSAHVVDGGASDGVPSDVTEDDWSRGSGEDPDSELDRSSVAEKNMSDLDRKVHYATKVAQRQCHCSDSNGKCQRLKVKKVGEGRYNIAGRNIFVRLLKGRHMMVRVGGGWDTLDNFLQRHDPCQIRSSSVSRPSSPARSMPATPMRTPKHHHRSAQSVGLSALRMNYRSSTLDSSVGR